MFPPIAFCPSSAIHDSAYYQKLALSVLAPAGFGVVTFDLAAHGLSGSRYGVRGYHPDVNSWVDSIFQVSGHLCMLTNAHRQRRHTGYLLAYADLLSLVTAHLPFSHKNPVLTLSPLPTLLEHGTSVLACGAWLMLFCGVAAC
jgi:alpha-beta hydrolase superfamily lysophospholipase